MPFSPELQKMMDKAKASPQWEAVEASSNLQINLYNLRKRKGWTQRQLGERLGKKQPHINRHESRGDMPSMESLSEYAHIYGVTIADLLGEPMFFPPHPMFNDEGEQIGTYSTDSNSATIMTEAKWEA